jgi:hypothetical protein
MSLKLAATGVADTWCTGQPTYSHFLMNFKRHTKFAQERVETPFDGDIDFGQEVSCRIPHNKGDLIRNMTLKITLSDPQPDESAEVNDVYWPPSVCTHLIEYADLVIGGQTIQRLTGEYIYMRQQLYNNDDDVNQTVYFLTGHGDFLRYRGDNTYFLDLPFYNYRNPSLAIPVCALTKQLVEVRLKLRPISEMVFLASPSNATAKIQNISLDTDFVYITEDEVNFLRTRPVEYVITQLQMSKFVMRDGEDKKSVMLNFKHPVKTMYVVSQNGYPKSLNIPTDFNTIKRLELRFNDKVVFNENTKFLTYEQPLKGHVNIPVASKSTAYFNPDTNTLEPYTITSTFAMYTWSLYPERHYPTGQVNMSRIIHKLLEVELTPLYSGYDNDVRVYAENYNVIRFEHGLAGLRF